MNSRTRSGVLNELRKHVAEQKSGSNALRLWRAAGDVFPPWFSELKVEVRDRLAASRPMAKHIDVLNRILSKETDDFAARYIRRHGGHRPKKGLIDHRAQLTRTSPGLIYDEWTLFGGVFHDAAHELRVLPAPMEMAESALLQTCQVCWRTAFRSEYGKHYCFKHRPGSDSSEYKEARRLLYWQAPEQADGSPFSHVFLCWREAAKRIPSGLKSIEPTDQLLWRLRHGEPVDIEEFPQQQVDLNRMWRALPRSWSHINTGIAFLDPADIAGAITALDPIEQPSVHEHQLLHRAMQRDQRIFVEMLHLAEAWLEAGEARRHAHGGSRSRLAGRIRCPERHMITLGAEITGPLRLRRMNAPRPP